MYLAGVSVLLASIIISVEVSLMLNRANGDFYTPMSITSLLESAAIFIFFKRNFNAF